MVEVCLYGWALLLWLSFASMVELCLYGLALPLW